MTTGSNTSKRRVTSVCRAVTISQAAGMGSLVRCGREAWPPCPRKVTSSTSAAAMIVPGLVAITPAGQSDAATCSAYAGHRPVARRVEHALLDHQPGPAAALLARLEHEDHVPGEPGLASGQQARRPGEHGGMQVVAAGGHGAIGLGRVVQAGPLGDR